MSEREELFLIVYFLRTGVKECEPFRGTLSEAKKEATADGRDRNYDRKGYTIFRAEPAISDIDLD